MSDIEEKLQEQIKNTITSVEAGELSAEDGKMVLEEIEKAYSAMDLANKEVLVRHIAAGIKLISKLI